MKTRALLSSFLIAALPILALMAQDNVIDHLTVPFTKSGEPGRVQADLLNGSITVIGYEGAQVDITTVSKNEEDEDEDVKMKSTGKSFGISYRYDKDKDEDKKKNTDGMYRIPVSSSELEVEEKNNHMKISVESARNTTNLIIKVPVNTSLKLNTVNNGLIKIENVNGEIEAENVNGEIMIKNVSGSVAASTVNGDVVVIMNKVTPDKPMSFNSFNGDVDVTLPAAAKASVKIKTVNGDVYSDFEIARTENPTQSTGNKRGNDGKYHVQIEHCFYGSLNGGGSEYSFSTHNGDIIIRKAK